MFFETQCSITLQKKMFLDFANCANFWRKKYACLLPLAHLIVKSNRADTITLWPRAAFITLNDGVLPFKHEPFVRE